MSSANLSQLRKKSFSYHSSSSPTAAMATPYMGIITSVGIRHYSPSSSMSTSNLAVASGGMNMKSPTNYSVGTFNDVYPSLAASPMGGNEGSPLCEEVTFMSGAHGAAVMTETLERSLSLSNLLGAAFASKHGIPSPSVIFGETVIVDTPIYTVVAKSSNQEDNNCANIFGQTQGPLVDSQPTTPRSLAETCSPLLQSECAVEKLGQLTSATEPYDANSISTNPNLKRPGFDLCSPSEAATSNTSNLRTFQTDSSASIVLRMPDSHQDEAPMHSVDVSSHSNIRAVQTQCESSYNNAPNFLPVQSNGDIAMFDANEAGSLHAADSNLGLSGREKRNALPLLIDTHQTTSIVPLPTTAPARAPQPPITLREATPEDAEGIIALRDSLDMTNATSFVWELEDMRRRIATRYPLVLVALSADPREGPTKGEQMVVGVSGIDVHGMEKDFPITSIGSRLLGVPAGTEYTFPAECCMCRGLLIHNLFQGAGLGSKLHKGRLKLLADVAPNASVILSARGSTIEETLSAVMPHLEANDSPGTPVFTKDDLFEFTFHTSQGIVHMVHGKDDGWKFVGVDIADGGPVWLTSKPLKEIVSTYDTKVERANNSFVLRRIPSLIMTSQ